MSDTTIWRDVTDTWHLAVAAGLTSPTSAVLTEALALLLAVAAYGHRRPAATLTAATASAALAAHLIH
ncbi:hypothetical protein AB0I84_05955 [Streptomyces spectabilis]|uniref:hypothetical protein n=1 Tax=Streptomyces spectabilis TaxID=68270 RepID=UPI0033F4C3C8